jgi:dienelactone hydrolase
MKNKFSPLFLAAAVACALAVPAVLAQAQAPAPARAPAPEFPHPPPPPYVTPATPQGTGPYPAIMEADAGLPTHTVYRPANLAALGTEKLPVVAFGNGACLNVGNRFRYFLSEIASYGFLAIATGPIGPKEAESSASTAQLRGNPAAGSPGALNPGAPPNGGNPPADTTAQQLLDAVTWAIAENARPASQYYGKIDTSKVAVMGQSCGGIQAIAAAHDPRVTTLGVWNSGAFPVAGRAWAIAAAHADKEVLQTLHGSAIYVSGEPSDVAFANANDDFERINGIPIVRAWREQTGHGGTYREPNGGAFGPVAVAWLQWQLKGRQEASRMFAGPDCTLCKQPDWHVASKNLERKVKP